MRAGLRVMARPSPVPPKRCAVEGGWSTNKRLALHGLKSMGRPCTSRLFLAVLLGMSLHCLFSVPSAVNYMGPRCMSMVCRLLVISGVVMLGRFPVVAGGVGEMF